MGISDKTSNQSQYTSLADALFTKTQQRVLAFLFGQPDRSFFATELIRLTGSGSGAVQRELTRLEQSGLVAVSRVGNQKHFQANSNSPLYDELCGIVRKTVGLAEPLHTALVPLAERIDVAFVYGSVASGQDTASSDIDLMVIGSVSFEEVVSAVYPCHSMLGREINPSVYSISDFAQKIKEKNAFITQVMEQPKLMILGREDDIRKFGQDQQTQVT